MSLLRERALRIWVQTLSAIDSEEPLHRHMMAVVAAADPVFYSDTKANMSPHDAIQVLAAYLVRRGVWKMPHHDVPRILEGLVVFIMDSHRKAAFRSRLAVLAPWVHTELAKCVVNARNSTAAEWPVESHGPLGERAMSTRVQEASQRLQHLRGLLAKNASDVEGNEQRGDEHVQALEAENAMLREQLRVVYDALASEKAHVERLSRTLAERRGMNLPKETWIQRQRRRPTRIWAM